jgi:hypothetical protein
MGIAAVARLAPEAATECISILVGLLYVPLCTPLVIGVL